MLIPGYSCSTWFLTHVRGKLSTKRNIKTFEASHIPDINSMESGLNFRVQANPRYQFNKMWFKHSTPGTSQISTNQNVVKTFEARHIPDINSMECGLNFRVQAHPVGHHVWCGGDVDERLWGVSDTGILRLGFGKNCHVLLSRTFLRF